LSSNLELSTDTRALALFTLDADIRVPHDRVDDGDVGGGGDRQADIPARDDATLEMKALPLTDTNTRAIWAWAGATATRTVEQARAARTK
jgi:hypothetical protein